MAPAMLLPAEGCVGGAGGGMIASALDGCRVGVGAAATAAFLKATNLSANLSNSLQSLKR